MPAHTNKLSDIQLRNLKPQNRPVKLADGGGLHVMLSTTGRRIWRMSFRWDGKQQTLTLGRWPQVSLADARRERDRVKDALARGEDPRKPSASPHENSFRAVAERWFATRLSETSLRNRQRARTILDNDLLPHIGDMAITSIEAPHLLKALRVMEGRGVREQAHRARKYAGQVFRFAIAEGIASRDPSHDLRDALIRKPGVRHQLSLSEEDLPEFLRRLYAYDLDDVTRDALMFTILTAARTAETRFAHADEFSDLDGENPLWSIRGARMKMGRDHIVPLSRQAAAIAQRWIGRHPSGHLFASPTRSGVISENTMLYALYRLGYHSRATVHGFRGTFSTIANEREWNPDWIELALAHVEGGVRGAYNAARYLPQRRQLLQWWADFIDEKRG